MTAEVVTDENEPSLVVWEDQEDGMRMHVEMADMIDEPYDWGIFLADIARAIGRDIAESCEVSVEQARAEIRAGFDSGTHFFRSDLFTDQGMSEEDARTEMQRQMIEAHRRYLLDLRGQ